MNTYRKEIVVYEFKGLFDGFCVEVHTSKEETDFYLYHKRYGDKLYMFGVNPISDEWEIRDTIFANIEHYIEIYTDKFIAEEIA